MSEEMAFSGRSFVVELRSVTPGLDGDIGISDDTYRGGVAQNGWLVLRGDPQASRACRLFFDREQGQGEGYAVHPAVHNDPQRDREEGRLEISRNGYLGFYRRSTSGQCWRLRFSEALGDDWFAAELRSAQGELVRGFAEYGGLYTQCLAQRPQDKCVPLRETYLNVQQGAPLHLQARVVQVL